MITSHNSYFNTRSSSSIKADIAAATSSDLLSRIVNKQIEKGIESYIRTLCKQQMEFVKYLYYYYKKWNGNIQIPIENLCNRFGLKERWVHVILARLRDKGLLITTQGGYGQKVTARTFTDRGLIVMKNILPVEKISKHVIHKNSADYCADYSGGHTNYISSKEDKIKETSVSQVEETEKRGASYYINEMRRLLNG